MAQVPTLALGLDFGTSSVRALLVDIHTGKQWGEGSAPYTSGVMDQYLRPSKAHTKKAIALPPDYALQNGQDYLDAMVAATNQALSQARTRNQEITPQIIGMGIDFTASTPLPLKEGKPLSEFLPESPHAYVKLWKHHGAQPQADFINNNAPWDLLSRYGGAISCEWSLPKLLEVEAQDPEAFKLMDRWVEAGDWVVSALVGRTEHPIRSQCHAGYKGLWSEDSGYPHPHFLRVCSRAVAERFETLMGGTLMPLGAKAGSLTDTWAARLGLPQDLPVAVAAIDAHAGVPGSGVSQPGSLLCILGTSTCHMGLSKDLHYIRGVAGAVRHGIIPDLVGYEAGQPAVGDLFAWFLKFQKQEESSENFQAYEVEAAQVPPGSEGIVALDWWNGNRSPHMDARMKGTLIGMRLSTTEAQVYRALLESTAYGTKLILDTMAQGGVPLNHVVLSGGIAAKSPLLCQIYADVLDTEVMVVQARQPVALGAAIYGAAAARGGDFHSHVTAMTAQVARKTVAPQNPYAYKKPYTAYNRLQKQMYEFYKNF